MREKKKKEGKNKQPRTNQANNKVKEILRCGEI